MKKIKPVRPFKTIEDEAHFWDTHDISNLFDGSKEVSLVNLPRIEKEKKSSITLRIQPSIKKKIELIAHKKGLNSSALSRMWIIEKVTEIEQRSRL